MTPSTRRVLVLVAALLVPATLAVQKEELPASVAVVLKGHTEAVYAVAYTPDGKHVVTGSFDRSIRIWDAGTGREIRNYSGTQGHTNLVLSLSLNAEGTQIASGGADNTARVWDFPTSKALRTLALADAGTAVAIRPDGQHFAAAAKDGLIKVWNIADGKEVFTLKGHTGAVLSLSYSPNSQTLISGGADGTLRAWNAANGQSAGLIGHPGEVRAAQVQANNTGIFSVGADGLLRQWTLPIPAARGTTAHAGDVTAIALSPDSSQVYTAGTDKVVRVSSFANGTLTRMLQGPNAAVQCLSVSGGLVVAGTADGQVFLWNANDGKLAASFQAHASAVEAVSLSPVSNQLLTAGKDGRLRTWALPISPTRLVKTSDEPRAAVLSADGKRLWVAGKDKVLRSWNLSTSQFDRQLPGHEMTITALAVQASGQLLASGDESGQVRLWAQSDGKTAGTFLAHAGAVQSLAFHPSGQQLLSTGADGTLKVWSLSVKPVAPIPAKEAVLTAVLSPDGSRVVTGEKGGKVRTWVVVGGQNERTFEGLKADPTCLAHAGTRLAAGSGDQSVTIWNADGKPHKTIAGLQSVPQALVFSADGKQLLAGLADGSLRLLDVEQGKETKKIPAHKGSVTALALTPKGDLLVSAGADNAVKTWKPADLSAGATLTHDQPLSCLALSRDGSKVAAGSSAKSIRVWTLADGKPVATLTTPAEVRSLAFSGDGTRLLAGGGDGLARLFDLRGRLLEQFKHDAAVSVCLPLPDGKRFLTAGLDKTIRVQEPALLWSGDHERGQTLAQFNARGDRVVSGGADKRVRLWNSADGKELRTLTLAGALTGLSLTGDGNRAFFASADGKLANWTIAPTPAEKPSATFTLAGTPGLLAVNSAGTRLAVARSDGKGANSLIVLDGTTGKELQSISEVNAAVSTLTFQADGRTLLAASADRQVRLVDVTIVNSFEAHAGGVKEAVYRNDGKHVLAGGVDRAVKLWDASTGKEVKTFATLADPISALAFSRDYTLVAAAAGKVVKVWNEATGRETLTLTLPAAVAGLSFNGDRSRLAAACADGRVRLLDVASGRELEAFLHAGTPRSVVYHVGNAAIIAGGTDKQATIHLLRLARIAGTSEGAARALAVHPNGQHVILAGDGKTARIWNLGNNTNPERTLLGSGGALNAVAVTRNGTLVATAGEDRTVRLYNFSDARPVGSFKTAGVVRALSFSSNNQTLAAACADGAILTWNVAWTPGQPLPEGFGKAGQSFQHEGAVQDVAFAPDNVTLCTTGADRSVRLWRLATDAPTRTFQHPNIVNGVAFNPEGTLLATACHDGQVRIYDVGKNTVVRTIQAHNRPAVKAVYCLAFSPDGKQLLSGSEDQTLKLWDAGTGNLIREFKAYDAKAFPKGHRDAVYCLAFSPDGKTVASGGADRTIKLWNVADGAVLRELVNPAIKVDAGEPAPAQPGYVYAVRFTADGKKLLSAGHAPGRKGSLSLWSVPEGKLLHTEEMTLGQFYAAVLSPDGKYIAVGVGPKTGTGLGNDEGNLTYILKAPAR